MLTKLNVYGGFFAGDPHSDANAVGTDAFRTLFVGRIVCRLS